jgi:LmbE family N-acetylglucosaminyl deacetylase
VSGLLLARPEADCFVPDGAELATGLERTTDLGIGAHPDDLEFMCITPIGECRTDADRWFTGVTCTDGAGATRRGRFAASTAAEIVEIRRGEQRRAAEVGAYGAMVQLGHPSAEVRDAVGFQTLVEELTSILAASTPTNVYTHNPADKHDTHVAVGAAVIHAVRALPPERRPTRLVGIEGWRDLDWLVDGEKLRLDVTPHSSLAVELAAVFESQIEGSKPYDRAARGRRFANATLYEPRAEDDAEEVVVAIELTPLVRNDDLDPVEYVTSAIERFRAEVVGSLGRYFDTFK